MNNTQQVAFGQLGSKLTTADANGNSQVSSIAGRAIVAITVLADSQTIYATAEHVEGLDGDGVQDRDLCPDLAIVIPKGVTVYGRWTSISSTSANGAIYYFG